MENKTYRVYKILAPSGRCYIGYTSLSLNERWRHHKVRAESGEAPEHPFYNEIRETKGLGFQIRELYQTHNRFAAMRLEQLCIRQIPTELSLNLSSGGLNDAREGGKIFWERLNADPCKRKEYLRKLSERKKANDWTDYEELIEKSKQWRREHPREAYKMAYRAIRIARRVKGYSVQEDERPLKERLMHKYRRNELKSEYVTRIWAGRTEEEKQMIFCKISESRKRYCSGLTNSELSEMTSAAREAVDREKQGRAASQGLKRWWAELKADPVRYKKYMEARSASLQETLSKKGTKHEDL